MKIFLDTASVKEIREAACWGILDGVTTNPSLVAKEGRDFYEVVREVGARSGVDPTQVQQECLKVVRLMIDRGFLLA